MKALNQLRPLSASFSLVILALGFSALGFISFIHTQPVTAESVFSAEHAYSFIGSTFSILVGVTFLVAAVSFKAIRPGSQRFVARITA
jgi:hypothetical protein